MPGIIMSSTRQLVGRARARRHRAPAAAPMAPSAEQVTAMPQAWSERASTSRLVALSSTTSDAPAEQLGAAGARAAPATPIAAGEAGGEPERASPTPAVLSALISPPMSPTIWREIARPRPVPPYLRVVEPSAWTKAWNSRGSASARDADAGVAHLELEQRGPSAVVLDEVHPHGHLARSR